MTDVERCVICNEIIPEGSQVCTACQKKYDIVTGETEEMAQELRDVAAVLKITEATDTNVNGKHTADSRQTGKEEQR